MTNEERAAMVIAVASAITAYGTEMSNDPSISGVLTRYQALLTDPPKRTVESFGLAILDWKAEKDEVVAGAAWRATNPTAAAEEASRNATINAAIIAAG